MWFTPIHKTNSIVSDEIWAVNITWRAVNTVTNTVGAVINRTSNAISKLFWGAWKILKNGLVAWWLAAAAITFPVSAPAIYGALATGKLIKNKAEGKGRWESLGNAITRPLWADTVAKYTDFGKVGEGIKDMTIWAGSEIAKWAGELITVPLIGAKFDDTHSSTGSLSDENSTSPHNPSTTSTEHTTTEQSSSKSSASKAEHHTDTVAAAAWWAVAWAATAHAVDSAKAEKEAKKNSEKAEKMAEAEKKKEEEKTAKEATAKTVDELNKQQKTFASKIDGAIKKVKDLSDAEKVAEKQEKFDEQNKFLQEQILDKIPGKKTGVFGGKTFADFTTAMAASPAEMTPTSHIDEYGYLKDFIIDFKNDIANKLDDNDDLPNLWDSTSRKFETREWKKASSSIGDTIDFINDIHRRLVAWQPLKKAHIENLFYYLWHSATEDGALQGHIEWTIKDITKLKKERINVEPKHIEKQQDKLVDALNKMKTESWKAVSSIASSSRLWGKKLNKDNASDALEQLADAMNTVTEQASAGEKRIDMTKPIAGISDSYQSLLSSIQSLTS